MADSAESAGTSAPAPFSPSIRPPMARTRVAGVSVGLAIVAAVLAMVWLVGASPIAGPEWPTAPVLAPGQFPGTSDLPGLSKIPAVRNLIASAEFATGRVGLFVLALAAMTMAWGAMLAREWRRVGLWHGLLALGATALLVLQPAHGLAWWLDQRVIGTMLANAFAWAYVALATAPVPVASVGHRHRLAQFVLLLLALICHPAACLAVPVAMLWRTAFPLSKTGAIGHREGHPHGPTLPDQMAASIGLVALIAFAIVDAKTLANGPGSSWPVLLGTLLGEWPVAAPPREAGLAAVEMAALVAALMAGGIAVRGAGNRVGFVPVIGAGLLVAGLARLVGFGDGRGELASGFWLVWPIGFAVLAVTKVAGENLADGRRLFAAIPAAFGLAWLVVLGVGLPARASITDAPAFFAALAPAENAPATGETPAISYARARWADASWHRLRREAADVATVRTAHADLLAAIGELPRPRTAAGIENVAVGVDPLALATMAGEIRLDELRWAKRLIDGRDGRTLPVAVQFPPGYDLPEPSVFLPRSMGGENPMPYGEFFAEQVAGFTVAWQVAKAELAFRTDSERGTLADVSRRQWQLRWLAMLAMPPERVSADLSAACAAVSESLGLGNLAPPAPPAGNEVGDEVGDEIADGAATFAKKLADAVASLSQAPVPGMAVMQAELLWRMGHADVAGFLATAADADAERDAKLLLLARVAFDRFNRHQAEAERAGADADATVAREAAANALAECRAHLAELANLPAAAFANRRVRLDGRRLEAFTFQFGPDPAARRQALDIYRAMREANPVRMALMPALRDTTAPATAREIPGSGEPDIRCLAGELLLAERQFEAAAEAFADEIKRDPRHTLARFELGKLHVATARAAHDALVREYTDVYEALPFEEQLAVVEELPAAEARISGSGTAVPIWELERKFHANPQFQSKLTQVTNLVNLAYDTDPANPAIRGLYSDLYFFRGDAQRALGQIDLAELFMRRGYVANPESTAHINGASIGDKLGYFYAELWKQFLADPASMKTAEGREAVFDLLSRALKISEYVRNQLYEFAKATIQDNPDQPDERMYPFYAIAAELYPEWAPARHWLGNFHEKRGEFDLAERELLAALNQLEAEGRPEYVTLYLELARHYAQWAAVRTDEGWKLAEAEKNAEAAAKFEAAGKLYHKAIDAALTNRQLAPNSPGLAWQMIAKANHELFNLAERLQKGGDAWHFLGEAIASYQQFLSPKSDDGSMDYLKHLLQRRIVMLFASKAAPDKLDAAIAEYIEWAPDPAPSFTNLGSTARANAHLAAANALLDGEPPNPAAALAKIREGLAVAPTHADLHLLGGRAAEALGDAVAAEAFYREAAKAGTMAPMATYHLGVLLADDRPRRAEAISLLVRFATDVHRFEGSGVEVPLATRLAANDAQRLVIEMREEAANAVLEGYAALENEFFATAVAKFELVVFTAPDAVGVPDGYWPLLSALMHLGRYHRAALWARRALAADPETSRHANYLFVLARAMLAHTRDWPAWMPDLVPVSWRHNQGRIADTILRHLIATYPESPAAARAKTFLALRERGTGDGTGD